MANYLHETPWKSDKKTVFILFYREKKRFNRIIIRRRLESIAFPFDNKSGSASCRFFFPSSNIFPEKLSYESLTKKIFFTKFWQIVHTNKKIIYKFKMCCVTNFRFDLPQIPAQFRFNKMQISFLWIHLMQLQSHAIWIGVLREKVHYGSIYPFTLKMVSFFYSKEEKKRDQDTKFIFYPVEESSAFWIRCISVDSKSVFLAEGINHVENGKFVLAVFGMQMHLESTSRKEHPFA